MLDFSQEPAPWVTITEYAQKFSVHRKTVYKWLGAGLVRHVRYGRIIRVLDTPPAQTAELAAARPAVTDDEPLPLPTPRKPKRQYFRPKDGAFHVNGVAVPDTPGVYVVRSGPAAKIGYSANLRRRLYSLQAIQYETLPVLGYIETPTVHDAARLEHELHEQFREARLRGEWFRLTVDVVSDLQKRAGVWDARILLSYVTRRD